MANYRNLYELSESDDSGDDSVVERREPEIKGFVDHWGWIYVVYQLAEFYRTSEDYIYELNIFELYNKLSFMKDKGAYDIEQAQKQMEENRL